MSELTACQRLDIIRHKGRPTAKDYIPLIFDDFFEMHGDRLFGDDGAVMGECITTRKRPLPTINSGSSTKKAFSLIPAKHY